MKQTYGIKLRLYPNKTVQGKLWQMFGNNRFVRNQLIAMFNERYRNNPSLYIFDNYRMDYLIKCLKKEYPFLNISDSSSFQCMTKRLYTTYKKFFKNPRQNGKPKFSSRKNYRQSYTGKSKIQVVARRYIKLPKLGIVKTNKTNRLKNVKIKQYILVHDKDDRYYLCLTVESDKQTLPKTNKVVGVDMGLKDLAILSDNFIEKLKPFKVDEHNKILWQRKFDRRRHLASLKVKQFNYRNKLTKIDLFDFSDWYKAHTRYARESRKIANKRTDYLHKYTTKLVKTYDVIVLEDLRVKNMLKNHKLAHAISNASWRKFRDMLAYKCEWYGKKLIIVNPRNTSRICSNCQQKNHEFDKLTTNEWLAVRTWTCPNCHAVHDRDVNAAINIKNLGLAQLNE